MRLLIFYLQCHFELFKMLVQLKRGHCLRWLLLLCQVIKGEFVNQKLTLGKSHLIRGHKYIHENNK